MTSLPSGTRVGPYEVRSAIGAGGMGQVFRAHDTSLHRDIALKILPPDLANDAEYRARFSREARVLASLNHPHIAQVYGLEDSVAGPAIVMELVPGVTLRERIRSGVSRQDAMRLAHQIAMALDAAHEKGIVHRDLKPGNVMVTPESEAKVLDFGLAKTLVSEQPQGEHDTVLAVTVHGAVVGTPAYMSPEQARGQTVDRRTDIWAFGCVLYELLAGQPPFKGESASDLIAGILGRDPDWRALPGDTPAAVRRLLQRCLEKDRRLRLRDIGDALPDLAAPWRGTEPASATGTIPRSTWPVMPIALVLAALAIGSTVTWLMTGREAKDVPVASGLPVRFALPPPAGARFGTGIESSGVSVSPDGATVGFVVFQPGMPSKIVLRPLGDETTREVPGTEGATSMFWSPDGRSLGFFAAGQLKRVELAGGAPVKICNVAVSVGLSGSWGQQGDILFATVQGDRILRVPAGGGTPVDVTVAPDRGTRYVWPQYLPDGRRFIYTVLSSNFQGQSMLVEPGGQTSPLVNAASQVQWIDPDWLVFVREGTLVGQRVDLAARKVVGEPVSIIGPVAYSAATGWSNVAASRTGTIVVQWHTDQSRIAWFDLQGKETGQLGNPGTYTSVRLAPDDSSLLFTRSSRELGTRDIWKTDLSRFNESPVTTSPGMETGETWLPGGKAIVFSAAQGGPPNVFYKDLQSGAERRLLTSPRFQISNDVTADGSKVIYQQRTELGNFDLMIASIADPSQASTLIATSDSELDARLSPGGGTRLSFTSNESGRNQVYVTGFPVTGSKTAVSTGGGLWGRWSRDGRQLYFVSGDRKLMVAPVDPAGVPGPARALFDVTSWVDYDVTIDGRVVAVVLDVVGAQQPLAVFVNWRGR